MLPFAATVGTLRTRRFSCGWIVGACSALGWNLAGTTLGAIPLTIEVPADSPIPLRRRALDTSMHFDRVSTAGLLILMYDIDLRRITSGLFLLAIIRHR